MSLRIRPRASATRCAVCRDDAGAESERCGGCGTLLHAECWELLWACPTLGCRPEAPPHADDVPVGRRGLTLAWLALVAVTVACAWLGAAVRPELLRWPQVPGAQAVGSLLEEDAAR